MAVSACVAEPFAERVGRPNQASRLRLLNGWRWAGREALAGAANDRQTMRVPARRSGRRLVLRTASHLAAAPQAVLDGRELEVRQADAVTEITLPPSDRLHVGELVLGFPVDTVLVDSRVLFDEARAPSVGTTSQLAAGEWARCLPHRSVNGAGEATRIEIPELRDADVQLALNQDGRWQMLERVGRHWRLPDWFAVDRAIVVIENLGSRPLELPMSPPVTTKLENGRDGEGAAADSRAASVESARPQAVLVFVMDALRAQTAERLERLDGYTGWRDLVAEGVSLRNHFAVAPNTLPSTKALFTGKVWPQQGGWVLRPEQGPTLAEAFRDAGYRTAMFSNNPYVSAGFGVDRGFEHVEGGDVQLEERNDDAHQMVDAAAAWIASIDAPAGDAPIFLYLHVLQPHNPYRPGPEALQHMGAPTLDGIDGRTATLLEVSRGRRVPDAAETRFLRDLYAAQMIEAVDQLLRLRALLEARFGVENVLTVATSDHGEEILEHDSALHGYTLYDEMIRIPALFVGAGVKEGQRSFDALTDTTDVHCWLRSLTAGESACRLGRVLADGAAVEPLKSRRIVSAAASVKGGIFSIRSPRAKFVFAPQRGSRWGFGSGRGRNWKAESLFDLAVDPEERNDLLAPSPGPATSNRAGLAELGLDRLRLELEVWLARQAEFLEGGGDDEVTDPAVERRLRSLGYVQ